MSDNDSRPWSFDRLNNKFTLLTGMTLAFATVYMAGRHSPRACASDPANCVDAVVGRGMGENAPGPKPTNTGPSSNEVRTPPRVDVTTNVGVLLPRGYAASAPRAERPEMPPTPAVPRSAVWTPHNSGPAAGPGPRAPSDPDPTPPPARTTVAAGEVVVRHPTVQTVPPGASVVVQLERDVCDDDLRRNAAIHARTLGEVPLSDNSVLPVNTPVTLKVVERRVAAGDQDPVIALEATALDGSPAVPVETKTLRFVLERPSMTGTVVKGTVIGALGGATLGLVLRQNVGRAALIGAAAGGAIGAIKGASAQACVAANSTMLPFVVVSRGGAQ